MSHTESDEIMSYLDNPETPLYGGEFPAADVESGSFADGIFTTAGSQGAQTTYLTVLLTGRGFFSNGVTSNEGYVTAIGPNSFVFAYHPASSGNGVVSYTQFTDPSTGSGVGNFDYQPYQYIDATNCFAQGTSISVAGGTALVENIQVGDHVMTASGRLRPVIWRGCRRIACHGRPVPKSVRPVRISAGAFAPGLPQRTLFLSPDHAVFADGVLAPVKHLLNGTTLRQIDVIEVTYHHIELESHDVVLAEGLPCESFLDTGNRASLSSPDRASSPLPNMPHLTYLFWETLGFAPLRTSGAEVDHIRARLAARARELEREPPAGDFARETADASPQPRPHVFPKLPNLRFAGTLQH